MLLLSQPLVDEIRSHGARDYPNETCGAMLGVDIDASSGAGEPHREVKALFPLTNRATILRETAFPLRRMMSVQRSAQRSPPDWN